MCHPPISCVVIFVVVAVAAAAGRWVLSCRGRRLALARGQEGAAAEAIKVEVGKLQGLKANLAAVMEAAESESTFDRKGSVRFCRFCFCCWWCYIVFRFVGVGCKCFFC